MLSKGDFESVSLLDVETLIENQDCESRYLEFKRELNAASASERSSFLALISSFANAGGGDVIFGMETDPESGIATRLRGVDVENTDQETLKLEQLVRDGIEPRLRTVHFKWLTITATSRVLIIRIKKSLTGPHWVKYQSQNRFFSRSNAGKYLMDYGEVRDGFLNLSSIADRREVFRRERIATVDSFPPIPLVSGARVILHLIPFEPLSDLIAGDMNQLAKATQPIPPMDYFASSGTGGWNPLVNFDGCLNYTPAREFSFGYCQFRRDGVVEAVDSVLLTAHDEKVIPSDSYEQMIIGSTQRYLDLLRDLNQDPPVAVYLSLIGVADYKMGVAQNLMTQLILSDLPRRINRPNLLFPPVIFDDYTQSSSSRLRPIIDLTWNACGFLGSPNYNASGVKSVL